MSFFKFFSSGYYFIKVWVNKMEIVDLETGKTIQRTATDPFSTKRVVFADFLKAEALMRSMLEELEGKRRFPRSKNIAVQQVVYPDGGLSDIEKRALVDSCEHAGGKVVLVIEPGSHLSNKDVLRKLKDL